MGLVGAGVAGGAGVGEVDAVAVAFDGPDGDLVGPQMGGVGCRHPLASSAKRHAALGPSARDLACRRCAPPDSALRGRAAQTDSRWREGTPCPSPCCLTSLAGVARPPRYPVITRDACRATRASATRPIRPRWRRSSRPMRQTTDDRHGYRVRAMIVVLWRAGLRVHEALSLLETDLDQHRGSLLVRKGKGGRRREIGMDAWGWEQLRPWLTARAELPIGPLFCVIDGPTRGRGWSGSSVRFELHRLATHAGVRRRFAPHQLRHAQCPRARPRRRGLEHHPAPARPRQPRHHLHLPARHRH